MAAITYRDRISIERGEIGDQGELGDFTEIARFVPATFWETLEKRVAVEGEVYVATAQALVLPTVDVERRDIVVARERRFEVMDIFPGRNLRGVHRFNHLVMRESDA